MKMKEARELASEWRAMHAEPTLTERVYLPVSYELGALLPDEGEFAVETGGGEPEIVGCAGGGLFVLEIRIAEETGGDPLPRFEVRREAVDGARLRIELDQRLEWNVQGRLQRFRSWRFQPVGGEMVALSSEHRLIDAGREMVEPSAVERLARTVCAEVGWVVPGSVED
jgi:hypothetical protein